MQVSRIRVGLAYGIGAYAIWGTFPIYFAFIAMVNPFEVVPWRVATTLLFCLVAVTLTSRWGAVMAILRTPRLAAWFALASILLYANWQIFVVAVMTGHVIEAALGYFINPLFTILIGVFVRKETLTRLQWIAVGTATVGVVIAAIAYGSFPWYAVGLALSFGLYGAVHKHVGENVDGVTGLAVETLMALPIATVQFVLVLATVGLTAFTHGSGVTVMVLLSGVLTAVPLILFGESTRRLPLSYLGFIQFLTPILGFLYGYFVAGEEMPLGRWIGFLAVWVALTILIVDMVMQVRRSPLRSAGELPASTGPVPLE